MRREESPAFLVLLSCRPQGCATHENFSSSCKLHIAHCRQNGTHAPGENCILYTPPVQVIVVPEKDLTLQISERAWTFNN